MSSIKVNSVYDTSGGSNAVLYGVAAPANSMGFRNRIINGDMRIDQRNGGASVTLGAGGYYTLDRWRAVTSQASKISCQQNAGAVAPPTGFSYYLGITSLSAYAVTGNDAFDLEHIIEGYNVADLNWGTSSAQPATLSFWVRSSLTGTFGGSIATTKTAIWVMPFTYTIASANTWTYITVAIPAATSTGGANTDNTAGVYVRFGLGATGTSAGGTAGSWTNAGNYIQPSGTVSVVGTNSATFYITGVQLEAGSVASPFERRPYGTELALCQRYYQGSQQYYAPKVASGYARVTFTFPVMRAAPTVTYADNAGTANRISTFTSADARTDGRTPVAVIGGNTSAFFVLPNNTDADIAFTVIASLSAEL